MANVRLSSKWRMTWLIALAAVVMAGFMLVVPHPAAAAEKPIKVGVLHSLSGTMAISETPLKEVILMAIDEVNRAWLFSVEAYAAMPP